MSLGMMWFWLISCRASVEDPDDGSGQSGGPFSFEALLSEHVPNVLVIEADLEEPGEVWAIAETENGRLQTKRYGAAPKASVPILGIPPLGEAEVTVFAEIQGEVYESDSFAISVGPLIGAAAQVQLETSGSEALGGYFLASLFGEPELLAIFDTQGQILWAIRQYDNAHGGIDSRVGRDGQSILFNRFAKDKLIDGGAIERIGLDGRPIESIATPLGHHIFDELPDGSLAYIALDARETEEYGMVCGDTVIEIGVDGVHREIYSTWDDLTLFESETFDSTFYPQGMDWTHGNSLIYDEDRDTYLFSMAGADLVLELGRDGHVHRQIGGLGSVDSEYGVDPPAGVFSYPHSPQWSREGELMMMSTIAGQSKAVSYEVRDSEMRIHQSWTYGEDLHHHVLHLGEVAEVSEDQRMVNWGSVGHLQVIDGEDSVLWEAFTPLGYWIAQADHLEVLPGMEP
jgi:hypothetical protein